MSIPVFVFSFVGGAISGIWIVAASIHYMLPDDWMNQWYSFPVAVTSIAIILAMSFLFPVISEAFSK